MLTGCLIFLCIGVFATCMPTAKFQLNSLNKEIQDTLETIIEDPKEQVVTMGPSNMMAPVLIPDWENQKQCPKLTLEVYIKLLNLWNIEDHERMNLIREKLQCFADEWALQDQKSDLKCELKEYTHLERNEILCKLKWFMKDLHCMQLNCD